MRNDDLSIPTEYGTIRIAGGAVADLVARTAARCYGVVGLSSRNRVGRLLGRERAGSAVTVAQEGERVRIDLHVVVEYGLNLAEVAATLRSQVDLRARAADGAAGRRGRRPHRERTQVGMNELELARSLARGGLGALEASRRRIDDLNVYPVPDGDTGTNLTLTVRAIAEALERLGRRPGDAAHEVTRAALMGARGNSGVILSQIVRGACESLARRRTTSPSRSAARATRRTAPCASRSRGRC